MRYGSEQAEGTVEGRQGGGQRLAGHSVGVLGGGFGSVRLGQPNRRHAAPRTRLPDNGAVLPGDGPATGDEVGEGALERARHSRQGAGRWRLRRLLPNGEHARRGAGARFLLSLSSKGQRSNGPIRAAMYGEAGDYQKTANDEILVMPMIETRQAVENIDEILDVPGIDAIYVGPADLAFCLARRLNSTAKIPSSWVCTRVCWQRVESARSTPASIAASRRGPCQTARSPAMAWQASRGRRPAHLRD